MLGIDFIKKVPLYLDVIPRLGLGNVAYVAWYRFTLKTGIRKYLFPVADFDSGRDFFYPVQDKESDLPEEWKKHLLEDADKIVQGRIRYYGRHWKGVGSPPDWFLNPFNGAQYPNRDRHWTELPEFHPKVGDIKNVWEASRFEWVVTLARAYAVSGKRVYLDTLNAWLKDWTQKNPLNTGPHWKCGQEAGIRIFNLMQAALILNQWRDLSAPLQELILRHLERIRPNIRYALAQDNNHGTSEAAALFIGGNWLLKTGCDFAKSSRFAQAGKKYLEDRVGKLVEKQGGFAQHSVTYHRVLLDTLCFAELWRKKLELAPFSSGFYEKAGAAADWLWMMTDEASGNAPNLGANDGALFLNCHNCDYRDFRPSSQLAQALFNNRLLYSKGGWEEPLYWLGIDRDQVSTENRTKQSIILDQSYAVLQSESSWGMLRLPRYRFRPGHNDVLHFDLWFKGKNICRDAGSYSYNSGDAQLDSFFRSVQAHSTVSFDDSEQMPRIGRFMSAKWVKAEELSCIQAQSEGSFFLPSPLQGLLGP